MSESRSEFEAWMDKPVDWHVDGVPIKRRSTMHESISFYAEFGFMAGFEAGRRAALEEAARICDETWVSPGDLQAENCHEAAAAIRALSKAQEG